MKATLTQIGCLVAFSGLAAPLAPEILEPASVEGLEIHREAADIVLGWPSEQRESFVVLWRSNATLQTPWVVLASQVRAHPRAAFRDVGALKKMSMAESNTNLASLYRVFVVPGFWFAMDGITLSGGPKNPGEDFLPFFRGARENGIFKPEISLLVDGKDEAFGEEDIQRVNFGAPTNALWTYANGFWLRHDFLESGEHTLQLQTRLRLNNFVGVWSWDVVVSNATVRVRIRKDIREQPRGSQLLLKGGQSRGSWWIERLGRNFVRVPPSVEQRRRRFIYQESHPLEDRVPPRPYNSLRRER